MSQFQYTPLSLVTHSHKCVTPSFRWCMTSFMDGHKAADEDRDPCKNLHFHKSSSIDIIHQNKSKSYANRHDEWPSVGQFSVYGWQAMLVKGGGWGGGNNNLSAHISRPTIRLRSTPLPPTFTRVVSFLHGAVCVLLPLSFQRSLHYLWASLRRMLCRGSYLLLK